MIKFYALHVPRAILAQFAKLKSLLLLFTNRYGYFLCMYQVFPSRQYIPTYILNWYREERLRRWCFKTATFRFLTLKSRHLKASTISKYRCFFVGHTFTQSSLCCPARKLLITLSSRGRKSPSVNFLSPILPRVIFLLR